MLTSERASLERKLGDGCRARALPGGAWELQVGTCLDEARFQVTLRWGAQGDPEPELHLAFWPWSLLPLGDLRGLRHVRPTTRGGIALREEYLDEDSSFALTLTWTTARDEEPIPRLDIEHPPHAVYRRPVALAQLGKGWQAAGTPLGGADVLDVHRVPEADVGVTLRWTTDAEPVPIPEIELVAPTSRAWPLLPLAFLWRSRSAAAPAAKSVPTALLVTVAAVAVVAAAGIGGYLGLHDEPREQPLEETGFVDGAALDDGAQAPDEQGALVRVREAIRGLFGDDGAVTQDTPEKKIDLRIREESSNDFLSRLNLAPGDVTIGELDLVRAGGRASEIELSYRLDVELIGHRRGERLDDALYVRSATFSGVDLLAHGHFDANGDGRVTFREFSVGDSGLPPPPRDVPLPFHVELVFDPRTADNGSHFRPQRLETTIYFVLDQVVA